MSNQPKQSYKAFGIEWVFIETITDQEQLKLSKKTCKNAGHSFQVKEGKHFYMSRFKTRNW